MARNVYVERFAPTSGRMAKLVVAYVVAVGLVLALATLVSSSVRAGSSLIDSHRPSTTTVTASKGN